MNDLDLQNVGNPKWDRLKPEQRARVAERVMRRTQKAERPTPVREPPVPAVVEPKLISPAMIAPPVGVEEPPVISEVERTSLLKLNPDQRSRVADRILKRSGGRKAFDVREPAAPAQIPAEYVAPLLMTLPMPGVEKEKLARLKPEQRARVLERVNRRSEEAPSNRPPEELPESVVMPAPVAVEIPAEYVTPLLMRQEDEDQDLANVPVEVRNKLARLAPEGMERVKNRVRQRMRGESAKKLERIRREEDAKANEIMKLSPATEIFDRQEYPGGWPAPARTIPRRVRFTPQAPNKLVDIPIDLQQTIKNEIVEEHGIPPDEADVIASNAIDRWTEILREPPAPTSDEEAKLIAEAYQPAFMIEKLPAQRRRS